MGHHKTLHGYPSRCCCSVDKKGNHCFIGGFFFYAFIAPSLYRHKGETGAAGTVMSRSWQVQAGIICAISGAKMPLASLHHAGKQRPDAVVEFQLLHHYLPVSPILHIDIVAYSRLVRFHHLPKISQHSPALLQPLPAPPAGGRYGRYGCNTARSSSTATSAQDRLR